MTVEEWKEICSQVTDRMKEYVQSFVCPLSRETEDAVRLVGTGSLVCLNSRAAIISCEHVANKEPLNFRYPYSEDVFGHRGDWRMEKEPIDVGWTESPIAPTPDSSHVIPPEMIAQSHSIFQPEELLFFYGFAGENSTFAFEQHVTNGTGYLTQQNRAAAPDSSVIELLWPPEMPNWSSNTTPEAKRNIRFGDPHGFSGSLVWNTRFLETGGDLGSWTPANARVTGLLKRFVEEDSVLLATPIECVRKVTPFP